MLPPSPLEQANRELRESRVVPVFRTWGKSPSSHASRRQCTQPSICTRGRETSASLRTWSNVHLVDKNLTGMDDLQVRLRACEQRLGASAKPSGKE